MKQLLFFLFLPLLAQAQIVVKGAVTDAATDAPLAFANVSANGRPVAITDVDGRFRVDLAAPVELVFSYPGYRLQRARPESANSYFNIRLAPETGETGREAAKNANVAANSVVRLVIERRNQNDPQKRLASYRFNAYNKLVVTAEPDSIDDRIGQHTVSRRGRKEVEPDSTVYKFRQLMDKQHLYLMERASRFEYAAGRLKETVLGARMAGFRQPVYEVIGFTQQSYSIYDPEYDLMETRYRSPLAENAPRYYYYKLLDTTDIGGRPAYVLYFRSKKDTPKRPVLRGLLYIDTETYGVAKAVMRVKGIVNLRATHDFHFLEDKGIWFPTGSEFRIDKGTNDEPIRILGETVTFDPSPDSERHRKLQPSDYTFVQSATTYYGLEYDVPVDIRRTAVSIDIRDSAIDRDTAFWDAFRRDTLDARSRETYHALDRLSKKRQIERKFRIGKKIINGYLPVGPVDLDLRYLLSYNNYEGFRFGVGGVTNERLSPFYRMDGYIADGTKDGQMKYSLGGAARVGKFSGSWMGVNYTDDIREIASTSFAIDKRVFKIYDPRPINISTFYNHKTWRGYIETRIIPKTESIWQLQHSDVRPLFGYEFVTNGQTYSRYTLTTASLALQWNPFSDYMQTPTGRLEIEKRYPQFTFQVTRSMKGFWDSDFSFMKFDFRTEYEIPYLDGQRSSFLLTAGYANGDVPLTHLYNTSPNNLTKDRLLQRITIAGKNSFETMYFNEFFSSRYVTFQVKHGLRRIRLARKVKPSLVFVSRMAYGSMQRPWQHVGIAYKTLERGFFESGLELNKIYSGLGLTAFYRYGPNQLPRMEDNLAVKLSFSLDLGF
ncbi:MULTISPECIES: DUF5686 family protein [unclassified Flavobacterium]|uniref:DUF5686 family protein n=1 Tax=unclassified Flavobacterium TaxID=196869 RepID=UPI001F1355A6|nr:MULTISPECIES: DUF5686 family protein [unclassified Flavobacterium]UMY66650.1 DUF5686 and carboxypeptidase regulatory-like domain-containing protein [Flavobacterium sp. HJ-32-4]